MNESLLERIISKEKNQQKMSARNNKIQLLALMNDISEALEKGWSVTAIWETLKDEGKINSSYNTFRLHVEKYLNGQKPGYARKGKLKPPPQTADKKRQYKRTCQTRVFI